MTGLPQLRAARLASGYTLKRAGEAIGKTESHLSKIERGLVTLTAADAVTLARAFGVTVESMMETGEPVTD